VPASHRPAGQHGSACDRRRRTGCGPDVAANSCRPAAAQQVASMLVTAVFSALVTVSFQTYFTSTHIRA
jgi:hypothetical protein